MTVSVALAKRLIEQLDADNESTNGRLGRVRRYLKGNHDLPYMPRGAVAEYKRIAETSRTNWLPLIGDTFVKGLFVDGYRAPKAPDNSLAWAHWQANRLDARQTITHRGALDHGTSYVLVLPGRPSPVIRPLAPSRSLAWYRDDDDEYPEVAIRYRGQTADETRLWEAYDRDGVYTFARPKDGELVASKDEAHGLGVTPFVRFRDRLDGEAEGLIRPLITLQDRINEVVFSTMIALQYASFRQRWATGLAIPRDDDGNPVEPFKAAVDRLWVSDDPEARFGDFAQTEISGHLNLYDGTVRTLAAHAQISPNILTGDLVNLSAEALAQLEASTQRKKGEFETLFGESWESSFRLASVAAKDLKSANDTASQVRWRDTEAQALAATVDALGKLNALLQVPVEALWERVPGVTQTDIDYWKALRDEGDVIGSLVTEINRQAANPTDPATQIAAS